MIFLTRAIPGCITFAHCSLFLRFFFLVVYISMLVFSHIFLSTTSLLNKDVYLSLIHI